MFIFFQTRLFCDTLFVCVEWKMKLWYVEIA